jgi:hypothetical protein
LHIVGYLWGNHEKYAREGMKEPRLKIDIAKLKIDGGGSVILQ